MHMPPTRPSTGLRFADPPNPSPLNPRHIIIVGVCVTPSVFSHRVVPSCVPWVPLSAFTGPVPCHLRRFPVTALLAEMARSGVDRAVLITHDVFQVT